MTPNILHIKLSADDAKYNEDYNINNMFKNMVIKITAGTGINQIKTIT